MLTRRTMLEPGRSVNPGWWLAAFLSLVLFAGLLWMFSTWSGFSTALPEFPAGIDTVKELGVALVSPNAYVLPFEVASVLLLAALIGAIVVAWERKS
jgi:NADH-quinone oxidoreductase subunit J